MHNWKKKGQDIKEKKMEENAQDNKLSNFCCSFFLSSIIACKDFELQHKLAFYNVSLTIEILKEVLSLFVN